LWAVLARVPAPLVGLIFGSSTAGLIAAATAGSLVLHALTNVPEALLQRRFDFRQRIDRGRTVAFLRERSDSYQRTEVPRFSGCSSASRVCSRQAKKEDRCTPSSGVSAGIGRAAVRLFEMNIGSSKSLPSSSPAHRQHDERELIVTMKIEARPAAVAPRRERLRRSRRARTWYSRRRRHSNLDSLCYWSKNAGTPTQSRVAVDFQGRSRSARRADDARRSAQLKSRSAPHSLSPPRMRT
jgi:hypothetical protein